MAENEQWDWKKLFSGFFNGMNTAKALVTTWHQILIVLIIGSVLFLSIALWKKFHKPRVVVPPPAVTITTNNGKVQSSSDDKRKTCLLLNFCF